MFSLKGYEQEVYHAHDNVAVLHVLFVPGQLLLFSIDAKNRLAVRDLRKSFQAEVTKKGEEGGADNVSDATSVLSKWKAQRPGGANIF